jgi:hypothetical protein
MKKMSTISIEKLGPLMQGREITETTVRKDVITLRLSPRYKSADLVELRADRVGFDASLLDIDGESVVKTCISETVWHDDDADEHHITVDLHTRIGRYGEISKEVIQLKSNPSLWVGHSTDPGEEE